MYALISSTLVESDIIGIKTLHEYLRDYHKISIIGIAKNAGKTTVLNEIITLYKEKNLAVTSIGLDGEKQDNITRQEKPRVNVYPGMYVATAETCLDKSDAEYVVHEKTNIRTALGNIVLVEITKKGLILLAGPPSKKTMKIIIEQLQKYNPYKVLIDGALFRKSIASSVIADGIIFVTGASYNSSMNKVVEDTNKIIDQLQIDTVKMRNKNNENTNENIRFLNENDVEIGKITKSILNNEHIIQEFLILSVKTMILNGALTDRIVEVLKANKNEMNEFNIIVHDASHILISPENFEILQKMNVKIRALNQIEILFVAYNPTSPYSYDFDDLDFRAKLRAKLEVDVMNILKDLR